MQFVVPFLSMLEASPDPVHAILDIVTPLALAGVFIVGLLIRSSMAEAATKHTEAASEVKAELTAAQAKTQTALEVHAARDELLFQGIKDQLGEGQKSFDRIQSKLDLLQKTKT